jgi:hypothetical protein
MDVTSNVKRQAQAAGGGDAARKGVLVGWAAKGVVYLVLAWLVLQLARRSASEEASTTGALEVVAGSPGGRILLVVLGLGLLAYAVGRILEVTTLATSEIEASDRAQAVVMAVVYGALAVSAFAIAGLVDSGGGGGGGDQGSQGSAFLLDLPAGRFLVGAVGLGAMALGAYVAWTGIQQRFLPTLRTGEMSAAERTWTTRVGVAAYVTKGAIFALVGWFFLQSAIAYDPDEATGIDGALRRVADASWGRAVLVAVAVGLLAYGIFCLVEARYRRIGSAAGGTA